MDDIREKTISIESMQVPHIAWRVLGKINAILIPLIGMWVIWATTSIFSLEKFQAVIEDTRYTSESGKMVEAKVKANTVRIDTMEKHVTSTLTDIKDILKSMDDKLDNHLIGH